MTATTMRSTTTTRKPFETATRARDAMAWMRGRAREVRERMRERCERARCDAFGEASGGSEGASEGGERARGAIAGLAEGARRRAREREAVTASWSEVGGKENRERCVCAREAMRARFETSVDVGEWSNAGTKRLTPAATRRRTRSGARPRSAKKLASAQKRGGGTAATPGKGLRARRGENGSEPAPVGDETTAGTARDGKVPLERNEDAEKGSDASGASAGAEAAVKTKDSVENGARARDLSPNAADSVERGEAERGERALAARDYADVQTPKNVKKIAWQTAAKSSERVTRKSVQSAKRPNAPSSSPSKASVEKCGGSESAAGAAQEADGQKEPVFAGESSDKKKRAKARANGLAFLKADIPALAAKNAQASGTVVSTELKISPRTNAAEKPKDKPTPVEKTTNSEVKTTTASVASAVPVIAPRTIAPKNPVDQRSLTESFMIQPENAPMSSAVDLAPLSTQKSFLTPAHAKAFHSTLKASAAASAQKSEPQEKIPSVLAPASTAELNGVMNRLKRAMEARSRADEASRRQLESEMRQKEEERKRREVEMQLRKAKQADQEAREREERRLRQERLAQFRLQEEEAQRKAALEKNKWAKMLEEQKATMREIIKQAAPTSTKRASPQSGFTASASSEAEKRRRLLENAQAAIHGHPQPQSSAARTPTRSIFKTNFASASTHSRTPVESYPISPYCSSDSEDDERPKKMIPSWARGDALVPQLRAQSYVDPDDIFPNPSLTCSLGKIFKKSSRDRRRSSSNWAHDRLTLQEELSYKQKMGFR